MDGLGIVSRAHDWRQRDFAKDALVCVRCRQERLIVDLPSSVADCLPHGEAATSGWSEAA
jgi:hypothetical protein